MSIWSSLGRLGEPSVRVYRDAGYRPVWGTEDELDVATATPWTDTIRVCTLDSDDVWLVIGTESARLLAARLIQAADTIDAEKKKYPPTPGEVVGDEQTNDQTGDVYRWDGHHWCEVMPVSV